MISSREIQFAMCEMSAKTFEHELFKYIDICQAEVLEYILHGVEGVREKLVAWILGLKKYIPDGWKPALRVHISKVRRVLPKGCTMDLFNTVTNMGDAHYTRRDNVHLIPESILQGIRMKRGNKWSGDEMAVVCRLYQTGMMLRNIAKAIGRSKSAVETKLNRMGISKRCI